MPMHRRPAGPVVLILALLPLCGGCYSATGPAPGDTDAQHDFWTGASESARVAALRHELTVCCPRADPAEVDAVAGVGIRYGELLADEYGLSRPPEYHNLAVRLGLKPRGLCFELADDLYVRLRAMRLRTLDLHRVQAAAGHPTEEHNCVVVTDRGAAMSTGVVIDLWRYAGKTRFLAVATDHHRWHELQTPPPPDALMVDDAGRPVTAAPEPPVVKVPPYDPARVGG